MEGIRTINRSLLIVFYTAFLLFIVVGVGVCISSPPAPTNTASLPRESGRKMLVRGIGREMKIGVRGSSSGSGGHGHH
ncbi:unnamed protein product [Linum trigynum]|uniref:Transmembrane protein n=1 Tax=Linum trigynum TaxID=586398 RepID=A0AAV2DTS1_9ROSI